MTSTHRYWMAAKTLRKDSRFNVVGRNWGVPQLNSPAPVANYWFDSPDAAGRLKAYPYNGTLGASGPQFPTWFESALVTVTGDGPNTGLAFFTSAFPGGPWANYLHPGLKPPPGGIGPSDAGYMIWDQWHADQNAVGSGTCNQDVFKVLNPEIERHEGVTTAADSHMGVALKAYSDFGLATQIEKVYMLTTALDTVRQAGYDQWSRFHSRSDYVRRQAQYDTAEYAKIRTTIKCTLDYNLRDK